jgi:ABC-type polysaccharide/polyol phosphate export permease
MWQGDYAFALKNLVLKDFRIRYRNMSLGVFWSLLNPLVMMVALTFVFRYIFRSNNPDFPVFLLCGLVPFSFLQIAWATGTSSLVDNAPIIKRVPMPREVVPIASVLSHCPHLAIQMALLIALTLIYGKSVHLQWIWLPLVLLLEVVFVCGLVLAFSAFNVYIRDTRYVVESVNTVLVWLVPVYYSFGEIPPRFTGLYEINPLAALIFSLRAILLEGGAPRTLLLIKLAAVSFVTFGIGLAVFRRLRRGFYAFL